jgi:hypothetical protein
MSDLAEKMKDAGVDTIGAQLTAICVEAIRRHPHSVVDAWRWSGETYGHQFIRKLMSDMQGNAPTSKAFDKIAAGLNEALDIARGFTEPSRLPVPTPKPYQPRVIPQERLEKRRELRQIVRSKYMNSGGISWSDVSWHELSGLKRDGAEAEALLAACASQVPNDGRTVGEVLGIKRTNEIIAAMRNK